MVSLGYLICMLHSSTEKERKAHKVRGKELTKVTFAARVACAGAVTLNAILRLTALGSMLTGPWSLTRP